MNIADPVLYYIHDPMCSWCWGFRSAWTAVLNKLDPAIQVQYLLGGLAPDTDEPMPEKMRTYIRENWQQIQQTVPGTGFNYDFWTACQPRRATFPACRAVIATRQQQSALDTAMVYAIQRAYYLDARNPSDNTVLIELAAELALDKEQFTHDLSSAKTQQVLLSEIQLGHELGVSSFPSVILKRNETVIRLKIDYNNPEILYSQIQHHINL